MNQSETMRSCAVNINMAGCSDRPPFAGRQFDISNFDDTTLPLKMTPIGGVETSDSFTSGPWCNGLERVLSINHLSVLFRNLFLTVWSDISSAHIIITTHLSPSSVCNLCFHLQK